MVAILLAATDTIAGELNSLSTATVIDFYKRWVRPAGPDAHYLPFRGRRPASGDCLRAWSRVWAAELGSLIEVVNRFGSFFYGSILGVFILAIAFRSATGNGAFIGLLAGMALGRMVRELHQRRLPLAQRHRRGSRGGRGPGGERDRSPEEIVKTTPSIVTDTAPQRGYTPCTSTCSAV